MDTEPVWQEAETDAQGVPAGFPETRGEPREPGAVDAAQAQNRRTVTMSRQVEDEQNLEVNVRYGAGRFSVGPAESGVLYHMQIEYDEGVFEPLAEYRGSSLRIGVQSLGRRVRLGRDRAGTMELALSRDVAMDLNMDFGAVRAEIDLGGIRPHSQP